MLLKERRMNMLTALGKELRFLRISRGELLKDMACKLSITPAYLSSIENGKRVPSKDMVDKIIELYRLDTDDSENLVKAFYETVDEVQFSLKGKSELNKNLGIVFARKFDELSEKQVSSIIKILNEKE